MKFYCANCGPDDNASVEAYENIDGYMVHCSNCMAVLAEIGFDEAKLFGLDSEQEIECEEATKEETKIAEDQYNLFEQIVREINEEEDFKAKVVFTTKDLELIAKSLDSRANRQVKYLEKTEDVLDKVNAILSRRECL